MKLLYKIRFIILLLTLTLSLVIIMAIPTITMADQPTINLGTTSTFAVLAGESITNTGTTIINGDAGGDVGLYPGSSVTGWDSVTMSGTLHVSDAVAILAKNDLINAYDDAAGRTPITTIPTELGGTTLTPGTYVSESGTFQITGTLILDAQGDPNAVFIFKTASTLNTASNSNINLIGEARYCRIFWQVGSSATLGTNSHFVGHIFALTSITATTGATIQGQLLARNGSVTLDGNTITNGLCETIPDTSSVSEDSSSVSEDSSSVSEDSSNISEDSSSSASSDSSDITSNNSEGPITGDNMNWLFGLLALAAISIISASIIYKKIAINNK